MVSNQTKKQKIASKTCFFIVLYFVLTFLPALAINEYCPNINAAAETIAIVCGIISILVIAVNVIKYIQNEKSFCNFKLKQFIDETDNAYSLRSSRQKCIKKIKRVSALTTLYIIFILVLFYVSSISFLLILNKRLFLISVFYYILYYHFLTGIFLVKKPVFEGILLSNENATHIYRVLNWCKREVGINGNVFVYLCDSDTVSVLTYKNNIYISIGVVLLMLLNKEELRAIFIHELAHVRHRDTQKSESYYRLESYLNVLSTVFGSLSKPINLLLSLVAPTFIYQSQLYFRVLSMENEIAADAKAKEKGKGQECINALFKIDSYSRLVIDSVFTVNNKYASKNCPDNFYRTLVETYKEYYLKNREQLIKICDNTIPMRIPSHPTINERKKFFEINTYNIAFEEEDQVYRQEKDALLTLFDNEMCKSEKPFYKDTREREYVFFEKNVEKYSNMSEEMRESLSVAEKNEYALSYLFTNRYEEAKKFFTRLLTVNDKNAFALFFMGRFLLFEYNDEGIEYIKKAIEIDNSFAQNGCELLFLYVESKGDVELRNQLREWALSHMQKFIDISVSFTPKLGDRYKTYSISKEQKEAIVNRIAKIPLVYRAKLINKISKKGFDIHILGVQFLPFSEKQSDYDIAINEIRFFLENINDGNTRYMMVVLNDKNQYRRVFKRFPSLIYQKRNSNIN